MLVECSANNMGRVCVRFTTVLLCDDFCYRNLMFSCCAGIMFGLVVKVRWNVLSYQAADRKVMTEARRRKLIVLKPLIQTLLHSVNLGREKGLLSEGPNNREYVSCLWIKLIMVTLKWKRDDTRVHELPKHVSGSANLTGLDLIGEKKRGVKL